MKDSRLLILSSLTHFSHANSSLLPAKASSLQSLASLLQHFIESDSPSNGRTLHAHIIKSGLQPNTNLSIKLLILHLRCGSLVNARKVFDRMPRRTLSAYNYMIAGYFKQGCAKESLELVRRLSSSNEKPDGFTLSMALKLSACLGLYSCLRQVHAQIVKLEIDSDDVVIAALVDSYVKNRNLRYARSVYDAMLEKNLVCSTALIVGYMNQGAFPEAQEIFQNTTEKDTVVFNAMIEGYSKELETATSSIEMYKMMQQLRYRPTISTFVSVIGACSLSSALEVGQQIHGQMAKTEVYSHVKCGSALVDMYAKCGRVEDARKMFDSMPERNVFTWTSMIDGYGKNGIPDQALNFFYEMKKNHNVVPNYATFLSVISACGHAGLVSSGQKIFESMDRDYKLKPLMEHYACMVDLLGRSGSLHEAYSFIHQIPEKPNSDVWTALLGASRLHGDVEMADIAAKEVFKLSQNGRPGAYIALSNTFAAAEKWKGVSEVRELMKARGVSKGTGQSWVEIDKGH
ncbi:pentatricopeptide repeat-containing protein [Canna indica]|uniref:Pentatricopeptide repeat-containing protein n=1 Tax=Canna indica TaxID=4628 RepID=A0AAQ3KAT5_9LILI|nr:pentatricopeptide repeat-containing protein [Canna indica]